MASPPLPAGQPSSAELRRCEWLREGMLQMEWVLAVRRYVRYLEEALPGERLDGGLPLAEWIHSNVLEPASSLGWIPGLDEHVLRVDPAGVKIRDWVDRTAVRLLGHLQESSEAAPRAATWKAWITSSIDQARKGPGESADWYDAAFPGPPISRQEVIRNWLRMAESLAAWERISPDLRRLDTRSHERIVLDLKWCMKSLAGLPDRKSQPADARSLLDVRSRIESCLKRIDADPKSESDVPDLSLLGAARRALDRILAATPMDWVPSLLLDFRKSTSQVEDQSLQKELLETLRAKRRFSAAESDLEPLKDASFSDHDWCRAAIVLMLVDFIDERHGPERVEETGVNLYDAVANLAERLELPAEPSFQSTDWAENSWWMSRVVRHEDPSARSVSRIIRTGVYFALEDKEVFGRLPEIQVSRPRPQVVGVLHELSAEMIRRSELAESDVAWLRRAVEALDPFDRIESWWRSRAGDSGDGLRIVWELLVRCVGIRSDQEESGSAPYLAAVVQHEFEKAGFRLVPVTGTDVESNPWCFVSSESTSEPDDLQPQSLAEGGIGLVTPDDPTRPLVSAAWIRVPRRRKNEDPILDALCRQSIEISLLQSKDSDWEGWGAFRDDVWGYVLHLRLTDGDVRPPAELSGFPQEFFSRVVARYHALRREGRLDLARAFASLARTTLSYTREGAASPVPFSIDPESLLPSLPLREDESICVELDPDATTAGVIDFHAGANGTPHRIVVGLDRETWCKATPWIGIPEPPVLDAAGRTWDALASARRDFLRLKYDPRNARANLEAALNRLRAQFAAPENQVAFDRLVHAALGLQHPVSGLSNYEHNPEPGFGETVSEVTGRARVWMKYVLETGLCRCWPAIDIENWRIAPGHFSGTQADDQAHITWVLDDAPRGEIVPGTEIRFSTSGELARVTMSLGPARNGGAVDLSNRIDAALQAIPPIPASRLNEPVRRIRDASLESEIHGKSVRNAADLVRPLLDGLLHYGNDWDAGGTPGTGAPIPQKAFSSLAIDDSDTSNPETMDPRDRLLETIRAWSNLSEMAIVPERWSFSSQATADVLPSDMLTDPQFDGQASRGRLVLTQFGLFRRAPTLSAESIAECKAHLSAGSAPSQYDDFRRRVLAVAARISDVKPLSDSLATWPKFAIEGNLEYAAQQLYVEFWKLLGGAFAAANAAEFLELRERLDAFLETDFGLLVFYPRSCHDHPERWLTIVSSQRIVTGRVTRIVRPGMTDRRNAIRFPAIVEVD